ncbi:response regulator [Granulosicoccus antarcticus]|uniref:histidine kinase n=1 Tax=Granulosicoccus antarcticus IMCC3135 TaxID=1192854 RepID=A0A2Z2NVN7_9GAMM|nr:response regulator [Granulosicoccus antarcticus]ASJ75542.1 Signal transduction histidine-protein kinase BarA [Granulosicoccus antarcticus IMCC3135]
MSALMSRELNAIAQRVLLEKFTPQWAIVDDDFQILEKSADTSGFLNSQLACSEGDILQQVQDFLRSGLQRLLVQARTQQQETRDHFVLRINGDSKPVTLTVQPLSAAGCEGGLFMVIVQESAALLDNDLAELHTGIGKHSPALQSGSDKPSRQAPIGGLPLEHELRLAQADLAGTVEELDTSKQQLELSDSALRRANDDLENLLVGSQAATLFLDDEHRVLRFTPAVCDIYNLVDEDINRSILDISHRVDHMPVLPSLSELNDSRVNVQVQVQTHNGRCFLRQVLPYRRSDKRPGGMVVTFTDITDAMMAEQFTHKVINSLHSFVGVCTTDGTLLQANESALNGAGVSEVDVYGRDFRETPWWVGLPESQRLLDGAISRAANGEGSRFDVQINLKGNQKATVDFQIQPMCNPDGTVTHLIPSAIDVTHRRQMEVALELAELKSRSLLQEIEDIYNSAPIGLCVLDRNLRWTRINKHLAEINGIPAEDHIGKSLGELLPDIAEEAIPLLRSVLESGEIVRNIPLSGTTPAYPGVMRHWVESWIPVRGQNDEVTGINIVAEEVTEKHQSEERLKVLKLQAEDAREQAENANRFKSEFLANMSHEIRTPMTAILGYADLLESHLTDPDNLQSVRTIKRNGRFLISLINDILDLSKIESGKLELERVHVSPVDIIEQTLDMMKMQADRKQLTLGVDYVGKLPVTLETDPTRLRQILVNLTGNAVKFTEQGSVTLRVEYQETPDPCVFFHIIDTGIGMSEEQQADVFVAFRQADSSISRRFGGSGLGLAISQRLASGMDGEISIKSELGKGSTLTLKLPAEESGKSVLVTPQMRQTLEPSEPLQSPRIPYRLLAVDDRRDVLHVVQHILEDAGAKVSTASGAAEALRKVSKAKMASSGFQAIVLDMQMPEINGYEAATTLREQGFDEPIIALTANAMKGERERCLAAGCTDYLTKPIDRHLLLEALARHVGNKENLARQATQLSQRILLVEDHEESARVLKRLLERSGHTVHLAHSAAQAMATLESLQPTVVLADIGLPDEDGYTLVARMQKLPVLSDCVFVALTGSSELEESCKELFDHHLTKPVEIERLRLFLKNPSKVV